MSNNLRQAAQQARSALANARDYIYLLDTGEVSWSEGDQLQEINAAITALMQALAEPEPKPIAWMCPDDPDRATAFAWRYGYCIDCGKPRIPLFITRTGETK